MKFVRLESLRQRKKSIKRRARQVLLKWRWKKSLIRESNLEQESAKWSNSLETTENI